MNNIQDQVPEKNRRTTQGNKLHQWIAVLVLVYIIIVAVELVSRGFRTATADQAEEIFAFATNPFLGLIVGTLASALTQSSSAVTSITVGLVGGGLPVATAVPIIMGANIGTSLTNTLVSLASMGDKEAFKRALGAATILDMFNIFCVIIFLPLEILFHPLQTAAGYLARFFIGDYSLSIGDYNFVRAATSPVVGFFRGIASNFPEPFDGLFLIVVGVIVIISAIFFISKLLKVVLVGRAKDIFEIAVGRGPIAGIAAGMFMTILVQSSTTTTCLIVPLAAAGVMTLQQVYPFTLGANIGTTVTAILAATGISGDTEVYALQIAMVHFLFNFFGVLIIFCIPFMYRIPIFLATKFASLASERKYLAFVYIIGVFFVIPGFFLGVTKLFG
jgi:sodium-dependent phosphate cotransporter